MFLIIFGYFMPILMSLYFSLILVGSYFSFVWFLGTHATLLVGLAVIAWTASYFVYDLLNQETILPHGRAVVISGCGSGFGQELAVKLDQLGFTVFATVRDPESEGAKQLREKASCHLRILKMDVTKKEDVEAVVQEVKASQLPLWAVVNNAGVAAFAPFDWGHDVDEHRRVYEVNALGALRVTKYFMPLLRQSKGRVINVGALSGRISTEAMSHVAMSKHALRCFSDVLRRELLFTGVKVITLEAIVYQTNFMKADKLTANRERMIAQTPADILADYSADKKHERMAKANAGVHRRSRKNVSEVTNTLVKAVILENPKLYYRCCGYLDLEIWAMSHVPEAMLDWVMKNPFLQSFRNPKSKSKPQSE